MSSAHLLTGDGHRPTRPRELGPDEAVLITGGFGFIGAVVAQRMLCAGRRIVIVDNGREVRQMRAERALRSLCATTSPRREVRILREDLGQLDLRTLLSDVGAVVHLAGRPGVQSSWGQGFVDHLAGNVELTQRLLEAAVDVDLARIVLASSSSIYGDVNQGYAAEDSPVAPLSPYGVSKASVEMLAGAYAHRHVPAVVLRFFSVYGRGQRPDMALARAIDASFGGPPFVIRGNGHQERDLTHVDDVARAVHATLTTPLAPGAVFNIGSGHPISLRRLLAAVEAVTGRRIPVEFADPSPGDPVRTAADHRRAGAILGWRPEVTLAEGLHDQIRDHTASRFPIPAAEGPPMVATPLPTVRSSISASSPR